MYQHFKAIADASDLPIIIYNIPGRVVVEERDEWHSPIIMPHDVVCLRQSRHVEVKEHWAGHQASLYIICAAAAECLALFVRPKLVDIPLIALLISFVILAAVLYGVVPGIVTVGGWFELFFVNVLGLPFNTGLIIYIACLVGCTIWAIFESFEGRSRKRENLSFLLSFALIGIPFYGYGWSAVVIGIIVLAIVAFLLNRKKIVDKKPVYLVTSRFKNTALLCMLMLMIGYSSYALIAIRSVANPPMDQNSPEDIFTLGSYLSRDQYGDRPLLYGQAYTSQVALKQDGDMCTPVMKSGAPVYSRKEKASKDEKDSYFVVTHKDKYVYAQNMIFPRMYDSSHAQDYESWMGGVDGTEVPYDRCGEQMTVKVPTQIENLRFFLSYQCNFMYWRYFMWNFAGRQNDIQGNGELEHGNWITGIPFIDNARLGDQSKLPKDLQAYDPVKNPTGNKGHNVFYCLPLILGLIGLFWQAFRGRRGIRQFWVVFFLFFMTGLAIVIYLNQTPVQPRERDYAYAGSFYAFAIWCGMGVAALYDLLGKRVKVNRVALAAVIGVLCLLVPVQMVSQTWNDHDRSGRYTCRDFGRNYLMSLQDKGNPIIFTNGDNDTFPLWYNQETEGVRTDARVCNLSYLQTDWYIDQMKRPAYNSPAVPISWPRLDYCSGTNEYIEVQPSLKQQILQFYKQNPEQAKAQFGNDPFELKNVLKYWVRSKNSDFHVIPTDTVFVTIDKNAVRKSGMMMAADSIPSRMVISLKGKNALYKNDLMMLEMIAQCNWTRPLYVAVTVGEENFMNLGDNFVQEGLANRITPFTTNVPGAKNFDTMKTYHNMMERFRYGGLSVPGLYIDETVMRMCYTHRRLFATLALHLIADGHKDLAKKALAKAMKEIPTYNVPMNYMSGGTDLAKAYALVGDKADALKCINAVYENAKEYVEYYLSLQGIRFQQSANDIMVQFSIMNQTAEVTKLIDAKLAAKQAGEMQRFYQRYVGQGGQVQQPGQ